MGHNPQSNDDGGKPDAHERKSFLNPVLRADFESAIRWASRPVWTATQRRRDNGEIEHDIELEEIDDDQKDDL